MHIPAEVPFCIPPLVVGPEDLLTYKMSPIVVAPLLLLGALLWPPAGGDKREERGQNQPVQPWSRPNFYFHVVVGKDHDHTTEIKCGGVLISPL